MSFDNLVFSVAYNMTGDIELSKDIVQDINLKFLENPISSDVSDRRNYVIRTTINHCLNLQKREQRTQYIGSWLPEPVITGGEQASEQKRFEQNNLLSYELTYLIEQLSPKERAVFILREAFDFDHKEIAESVNITEDYSRQLYKRSKKKVAGINHEAIANEASLEIAKQYVNHIQQGDVEELISLFNDHIALVGDGGGKVPAIREPLVGKEELARFFTRIFSNERAKPLFYFTEILFQPAVVVYHNDEIIGVQVLSLSGDKISRIFSVLNPDKLNDFKKNFSILSHN